MTQGDAEVRRRAPLGMAEACGGCCSMRCWAYQVVLDVLEGRGNAKGTAKRVHVLYVCSAGLAQ